MSVVVIVVGSTIVIFVIVGGIVMFVVLPIIVIRVKCSCWICTSGEGLSLAALLSLVAAVPVASTFGVLVGAGLVVPATPTAPGFPLPFPLVALGLPLVLLPADSIELSVIMIDNY